MTIVNYNYKLLFQGKVFATGKIKCDPFVRIEGEEYMVRKVLKRNNVEFTKTIKASRYLYFIPKSSPSISFKLTEMMIEYLQDTQLYTGIKKCLERDIKIPLHHSETERIFGLLDVYGFDISDRICLSYTYRLSTTAKIIMEQANKFSKIKNIIRDTPAYESVCNLLKFKDRGCEIHEVDDKYIQYIRKIEKIRKEVDADGLHVYMPCDICGVDLFDIYEKYLK
jgi:hypothetical protein